MDFVLEYSYWLLILHWNSPTGYFFFALEYSYWLLIMHWNSPADWNIPAGIFLLAAYLALEQSC
jgi:hypothetical protein